MSIVETDRQDADASSYPEDLPFVTLAWPDRGVLPQRRDGGKLTVSGLDSLLLWEAQGRTERDQVSPGRCDPTPLATMTSGVPGDP